MKKKIKIFYVIDKSTPQDEPNQRWYYINNYIGDPFIKFDLGQNNDLERLTVATHLGLKVDQIEFVKRGQGGKI